MTRRKIFQDRMLNTNEGQEFQKKIAQLKTRSLKIRETHQPMAAHEITPQFEKAKANLTTSL